MQPEAGDVNYIAQSQTLSDTSKMKAQQRVNIWKCQAIWRGLTIWLQV